MTILSYPLKHSETPPLPCAEAEAVGRVHVVHAEVKGRARLKVEGLYRCQPARLRIESALARDGGIKQVQANVLTGRVLVIFDPSRTAEEISSLVEALLATRPAAEQNATATIHPLRPL